MPAVVRAEPIGLWLLPILCGLGFATAFYVLTVNESRTEGVPRLARLSAEVGGGGGLAFWLVLRLLGFGSATFAPYMLGQAALRAAVWAVVAWPFTAWRLERTLGLPYHQSYNVTTLICGVALLLFFIAASAATIIAYL
ncbi:MAG: hypothetical protein JSV79_14200 [Armatimonadota bacterium]|nr:MAG: hypothetical protein JSV79_14200 [Armatimonadota bacterium]